MNAAAHPKDRLLELAYEELSPPEARAVQAHLRECPECAGELEQIRRVRVRMAGLTAEPAPEAGLESLLAYARQAAGRPAENPRAEAARRFLWRLVMPLGTVAGLALVLLVVAGPMLRRMAKPPQTLAVREPAAQATSPGAELTPKVAAPPPPASPPAVAIASGRGEAKPAASPIAANVPGRELEQARSREIAVLERQEVDAERKLSRRPVVRHRARARVHPAKRAHRPPSEDLLASLSGEGRNAAFGAAGGGAAPPQAAPPAPRALKKAKALDQLSQAAPAAPAQTGALAMAERPAEAAAGRREAPVAADEAPATPRPARRLKGAERAPGPEAAAPQGQRVTGGEKTGAASSALRTQEVAIRQALAAGAKGERRAELLDELCEVEVRLGERRQAIDTCRTLLSEFPRSTFAARARTRLSSLGASPAAASRANVDE